MEESKEELEAKVSAAMHARLSDFQDQADSLTLEGVRRVLEKDLGMKIFALDMHKKIVKQWMEKHFYGPAESDITKNSERNPGGAIQSETGETKMKTESLGHLDLANDGKNEEDSSLGGKEMAKTDAEITKVDEISEEKIKKAIKKRAIYFKENSENITMSEVRRLLEEDLKLAKNSLDSYKVFIKKQLDECLCAEVEEPMNGAKTSKTKKSTPTKTKATSTKTNKRKKVHVSGSSEDLSGSETSSGSEDLEEEKAKPRKKAARDLKTKIKSLKKQKISEKERKPSSPGKKPTDSKEKKSSDTENEAGASDDNQSSSSVEESFKKSREKPTPVYGKKVEHLKSVIKSCGMGVPPSVYRRAKDAPESKREAFLIKELEGILEREGLSTNPSGKEINSLKKRKERAKELEGIDMSNIVSSSRRRTASSFIPPKPQIPIESEEEDDDEEGDDEDDTDEENTDSGVLSEGSEDEEESD